METYTNGTWAATRIGVISGASLAHRLPRLDRRQRAVLAADVLDGALRYEPTRKEIAEIFRVNASYVDVARTLSPVKRAAILNGWDAISFVDLRAHTPALPKPITANGNAVDDAALLAIARHNPNRLWNALQTAETVVAVGAAE